MKTRISIALLALVVASPVLAQSKVDRGGRNFFSKQQDIEIGQQSAVEAEKQLPVLRDQQVQAYISELGKRLAAHAPGYRFPYTFKVVDVADINAFALPGGPLYINRGTVEAARTEGELAGVIAHEIAHVDLRHGTRQASKAVMAQLGLQLLGGLIGGSASTKEIINSVGGFGLNTLFLKYSRAAETDADILGSQIMARAGYPPKEMASFFQLLEQQSGRRTQDFFSAHPTPQRRRERIEQEAALLGAHPAPVSQERFKAIQAALRRLPPARTMADVSRNPRQDGGGRTDAPADTGRIESPSRTLTWYSSPSRAYRVAYPDNWEVISESDTDVTLSPRGGARRTSSGTDVIVGAMVGVYEPTGAHPRAGDTQLDADTDELVARIRRGSPYLRAVSGSRREVTIDSGPGLVLDLAGTSPDTGRRERVTVVTAAVDERRLVNMLFVTPDDAPREYDDLLAAMVRNLRIAGR